MQAASINCAVCSQSCHETDLQACTQCLNVIHSLCGIFQENVFECLVCQREKAIKNHREQANENLTNQARKMKIVSDNLHPSVCVGSTVRVPIPELDRGRTDARSVLAVVIDKTDDDFYTLGTRQGVINGLYSRSQIGLCPKKLVFINEVPKDKSISLRFIAIGQSIEHGGHGQGFKKCHCKTQCQTKKCACHKQALLCSSKCHHSLSCANK